MVRLAWEDMAMKNGRMKCEFCGKRIRKGALVFTRGGVTVKLCSRGCRAKVHNDKPVDLIIFRS
jgi:hypothetical protein